MTSSPSDRPLWVPRTTCPTPPPVSAPTATSAVPTSTWDGTTRRSSTWTTPSPWPNTTTTPTRKPTFTTTSRGRGGNAETTAAPWSTPPAHCTSSAPSACRSEAHALNSVGWSTARLGDYDTARAHCQAALGLNRRNHDVDAEAASLDSLGYIAHHTGHHRQAIDYYERALAPRRKLGNTSAAADTLDRLGHPHVALGENARARAVWHEARDLYEYQGRDTATARVQRQLDALDRPDDAAQAGE